MAYSRLLSTPDSVLRQNDFRYSSDEVWQDFSQLTLGLTASPEQLSQPLPDTAPSFVRTQPSSIDPSTLEVFPDFNTYSPFNYHGPLQGGQQTIQDYPPFFNLQNPGPTATNILTAQPPVDSFNSEESPDFNPYPSSNFYGLPLQSDCQHIQSYPPFFNHQNAGSVVPTARPYAAFDANHSSVHNFPQGRSYSVADKSSLPVHDASCHRKDYYGCAPFEYNGSLVSAGQTKLFNCNPAAQAPYQQTRTAPAGVVWDAPPVPFPLGLPQDPLSSVSPTRQSSRRIHSTRSSSFHLDRSSSLPAPPISPEQETLHTCLWVVGEHGKTCGAQITRTSVSEHLVTHGIQKLSHNFHLRCKWLGCRLKGNKDTMNRESIVRHVREKHLGCKRSL